MTYLGNAPGAGGFMFMRLPNNVLFYSTHCIFDEVLFPKCATPAKKSLTRLLNAPPTHHYHKDTIQVPVDEGMPPRRRTKNKARSVNRVHQNLWNLLRNPFVRKNLLKKKSPLVLRKKSPLHRGKLHLQSPH